MDGRKEYVSHTVMFKIMLVVEESSSKTFIIAVSISRSRTTYSRMLQIANRDITRKVEKARVDSVSQ